MIPNDRYTIRVQSLEFLPVLVKALKDGEVYNPTADSVQVACPVINVDPVDGDWKTAQWHTAGDEYTARILVGPAGDVTLARGDYDILVKITDNPETPVLRAGMLTIV